MSKKQKIGLSVLGVLFISVLLFLLFVQKDEILIEGIPTDFTNENVILKVKEIDGASYAFQTEEFSSNNTFIVEENIEDLKVSVKLKNNRILEKK